MHVNGPASERIALVTAWRSIASKVFGNNSSLDTRTRGDLTNQLSHSHVVGRQAEVQVDRKPAASAPYQYGRLAGRMRCQRCRVGRCKILAAMQLDGRR